MNTLRESPVRLSHPGWLILSILAILIVGAAPVRAGECVTHYSETFKFCGIFHDTCAGGETWTEDCENGCLKHFLRFENLPLYGTHKLRMKIALQDLFEGNPTVETVNFTAKQQSGCDGTGTYSSFVTCDEFSCDTLTDYNLGFSGTTDICVGIESNNLHPFLGECGDFDVPGREEVLVEHGAGTNCHSHPVIVTTGWSGSGIPDTMASSDFQTGPGNILFGTSYDETTASDDDREQIRESLDGGISKLIHTWKFTGITAGCYRFIFEGFRTSNQEGDNFQFSWAPDVNGAPGTFEDIPGAIINQTFEATGGLSVPFTPSLSGTIYIRVKDTNQTSGTSLDTLKIDFLAIRPQI